MTRFLLGSSLVLSVLSVSLLSLQACVDDGPLPRGEVDLDAGVDGSTPVVTAAPLPPGCAPIGDPLPRTLACTGLYGANGTGPADKAVHPANREFAPGTALWTDGADKLRWIALPEGKQIDTSSPNGWVFPDGTRVWKEFAFKGKRAETRFMYKHDGIWLFATYQWNENDTEAVAVDGAEVSVPGGGAHSIPTLLQCNECHRGSRDKLLGFQQVLLGLPGAKGLDLATLVAEKRLSNPPARTNYVIPDDGTGMSGKALSWLHVNCGVSCHNETGNAGANMSKMFLRLDPAQLDAPTTADWNIVKMTVGVPSMTPNFFGGVRIVPGSPDKSLIVQLAQTRGSNMAMPPIGTRIVDPDGLATVREWITRLGGKPTTDAGFDAGPAADAGAPDTAVPAVDAAIADAGSSDADVPDAEVADAGAPVVDVPDAGAPVVDVPDAGAPVVEVPDAGAPVVEDTDSGVPPAVVDPGPVAPPVTDPPVVTPPVMDPAVVTPPVTDPPVVAEPPVAMEPPVAAATAG